MQRVTIGDLRRIKLDKADDSDLAVAIRMNQDGDLSDGQKIAVPDEMAAMIPGKSKPKPKPEPKPDSNQGEQNRA